MNIVKLFDIFKAECPILAEHAISYKENKGGVNSIIIRLDDNREVVFSKSQKETTIKIKH